MTATEDSSHDVAYTEKDQILQEAAQLRKQSARFLLNYRCAMDEIMTKIRVLKAEFEHVHDYCPIEHVEARLKSPESILAKAKRHSDSPSLATIRDKIQDIAGVRVVCSFISDAYAIAEMLSSQSDVTVVKVKDYIATPKPNGYKSLHLIVKVPIFLSDSVNDVPVEVQIRTIAMDFWASLEHKIYYKFDEQIPPRLLTELSDAAMIANRLDVQMERIHNEVRGTRPEPEPATDLDHLVHLPIGELLGMVSNPPEM